MNRRNRIEPTRRSTPLLGLVLLALIAAGCGGEPASDATAEAEAEGAESVVADTSLIGNPCIGEPFEASLRDDSTIVRTNTSAAQAMLQGIREITELLATIDGAVYLRVAAPADEVRQSLQAVPTFREEFDLVEPEHVYFGSPINGDRPLDTPEPPNATEAAHVVEPVSEPPLVAVIDAEPDDERPLTNRGLFVQDILTSMGVDSQLFAVPTSTSDTSLEYLEGDLIIAAGDIRRAMDKGTTFDTVSLSFWTYGCADYEPGAPLQLALRSLGIDVVAPAGDDGVDQPTFPAAGFVAVGSAKPDGPRSCFSNYGPWVDHWTVGEEVLGALDIDGDSEIVTWSGTAFAAAQAAGSELRSLDPSASGTDRTPARTAEDDPAYGCGTQDG